MGCLCCCTRSKSKPSSREEKLLAKADHKNRPAQVTAAIGTTQNACAPKQQTMDGDLGSDSGDFLSCRDDFSVTSETTSPRASCTLDHSQHHHPATSPPASPSAQHLVTCPPNAATLPCPLPASAFHSVARSSSGLSTGSTCSTDTPDPMGPPKKPGMSGCLSLIDALSQKLPINPRKSMDAAAVSHHHHHHKHGSKQRRGPGDSSKPDAGCSVQRRDMSVGALEAKECWDPIDGTQYKVRGLDYMKTRLKVPSAPAIYRLVAMDMFKSERKQNHIARMVNLPHAAQRPASPDGVHFPPLLVVNLQMPSYPPSIFGGTDGPGWSVVFYYALPEDFDPAAFPNQKALGLLRRFVQNGREADGSPTRERLKMCPRVVNVEEWAVKAPLSQAEHRALVTYNEKPILSRPQHLFFHGHNYLEIDIDIHSYAYIARTAIIGFMPRLSTVVWDVAFVVQGNSPDELPEQLLACGRMYRIDFQATRPFSAYVPRLLSMDVPREEQEGSSAPLPHPAGAAVAAVANIGTTTTTA